MRKKTNSTHRSKPAVSSPNTPARRCALRTGLAAGATSLFLRIKSTNKDQYEVLMRTRAFAVGCLSSLVLSCPAVVYAGPGGPVATCKPINSIPTTINTSGIYCLTQDLSTSISGRTEAAIRIDADDVVLDLQQHVLDGSSADPHTTRATGILAQDRKNITVRNGTVRGFWTAIRLADTTAPYDDTGGHLVTGVRAEGSAAFGIEVVGRGNRVVNNLVLNTGGAILSVPYADEMDGIGWSGPDARILGNDIVNVHNTTEASTWGIAATGASGSDAGSVIEDNRISNVSATVAPYGVFGIGVDSPGITMDGIVIIDNTITNGTSPGTVGYGIDLGTGALCRNNTIFSFPNGIASEGCTDGGGNYPPPSAT